MEKMIVVVFNNQPKALEGSQILRDLNQDGDISVYDAQMVTRDPSGVVRKIDSVDMQGFPMIAGGTTVGALIGLLGGPVGALVGASVGALIGSISDVEETGLTSEFVGDVTNALTPGKVAIIADIDEEWVTPLDTRMDQIGGVVLRRTRTVVKTTQDDRDAAAHRAEMEQLKLERAQSRSDRLAKIDAKIDNLRVKLENAIERKRVKMQLRQSQRDAKIEVLQSRADQAKGETRRRQDDRIAALRRDYSDKVAVG